MNNNYNYKNKNLPNIWYGKPPVFKSQLKKTYYPPRNTINAIGDCFYHNRFSSEAKKCVPGCKFHYSFNGQINSSTLNQKATEFVPRSENPTPKN